MDNSVREHASFKNWLLTNEVLILQSIKQPLREADHGADVSKEPIKVHVLQLKEIQIKVVNFLLTEIQKVRQQ